MDIAKAAQIVALMLTPTLAVGTVLYWSTLDRAVHRILTRDTAPARPPVEALAADLRRLLLQHEMIMAARQVAGRAQRLRAIEGAITDCAVEAARALEVAVPPLPVRGGLPVPQLRRLLQALAEAGLALPPETSLLRADLPF